VSAPLCQGTALEKKEKEIRRRTTEEEEQQAVLEGGSPRVPQHLPAVPELLGGGLPAEATEPAVPGRSEAVSPVSPHREGRQLLRQTSSRLHEYAQSLLDPQSWLVHNIDRNDFKGPTSFRQPFLPRWGGPDWGLLPPTAGCFMLLIKLKCLLAS
jgi:hypothetical protein